MGSPDSLCPRTGETCEWRDACVQALDQAKVATAPVSFMDRVLQAAAFGAKPELIRGYRYNQRKFRRIEADLDDVLDMHCGSRLCIVEGVLTQADVSDDTRGAVTDRLVQSKPSTDNVITQ